MQNLNTQIETIMNRVNESYQGEKFDEPMNFLTNDETNLVVTIANQGLHMTCTNAKLRPVLTEYHEQNTQREIDKTMRKTLKNAEEYLKRRKYKIDKTEKSYLMIHPIPVITENANFQLFTSLEMETTTEEELQEVARQMTYLTCVFADMLYLELMGELPLNNCLENESQ